MIVVGDRDVKTLASSINIRMMTFIDGDESESEKRAREHVEDVALD
jgi:hypothetical protein